MASDTKPPIESESALSRWSRLKRGASNNQTDLSRIDEKHPLPLLNGGSTETAVARKTGGAALETPTAVDEKTRGGEVHDAVTANAANRSVESSSPALPPLESISLDADFTPFMQAKVPEVLKRQALKALFKEAHFNQMDGLDTYIDDYTQFDPISPEDLEKLSAWKSISKPLQQVVTPGGYAVDVESEEGKAVLAARQKTGASDGSDGGDVSDGSDGGGVSQASDESDRVEDDDDSSYFVAPHVAHARYGKRVGDFKPETNVVLESLSPISPNSHLSPPSLLEDPR